MNGLPKLRELPKEELLRQIDTKEIDVPFLCEYIEKRDKTYNKLIDKVNILQDTLEKMREYITETIICEDLGDGYSYNCDNYDEEKFKKIIAEVIEE